MPITACVTRSWLRVSTRMPPSFAPFTTRSLGHLSAACATPSARSARATATPATSDRPTASRTGRCRLRESENVMPAPGALCQRRPRRPRPAVCSSAASSTGPVQGPFNKTEFVEVQRPSTRTWTPGTMIAAASRRSTPASLREWLLYTPARHALALSENRRPSRRRVARPREHARRHSARGVARLPRSRVRRHAGGRRTPVLIHDETLERTTGVKGEVALTPYQELEKLDIPRFQDAARLCRELGVWANVEIKPAQGHSRATGGAVAGMASELWRGAQLQPLLSSFSSVALEAARAAAPDLPRGLLVDEVPADWLGQLRALDCVALHCNQQHLGEQRARAIKKAGYGLLGWTVNDPVAARRLLGWGVDCVVTDALALIGADFK